MKISSHCAKMRNCGLDYQIGIASRGSDVSRRALRHMAQGLLIASGA